MLSSAGMASREGDFDLNFAQDSASSSHFGWLPRSFWIESSLRLFGAKAEVVQATDINKTKFTEIYKSSITLLVIYFTCLEGRVGEIVVKQLASVDSHNNSVSSCL